MSRAFDAKQTVLSYHPDREQVEEAIELFKGYLDASVSDIEYELGMSIEEYLYGRKKP